MTNIVKAIEKEKEYLSYRMKNEEPFHLVDAVRECGFETLDKYFKAKKEYEFSKIKFSYIEKKPAECIEEVLRMIATQIVGVLFVDSEETFVFNGTAEYNKEYCQEHNIPVFPIQTAGGTIVCTAGDFSFGICCVSKMGIDAQTILSNIKNILQGYTKEIVLVDGNDILIDGKKVLGSAVYNKNNMFMFVAHVSFSDKKNLISHICTTTKVGKTVGYIDCINRDVFKQEVSKWLRVHSI